MNFSPPYIYVGLFEYENSIQQSLDKGKQFIYGETPKGQEVTVSRKWLREQTKNKPHNVEKCLRADCVTCSHYLVDAMKGVFG